MKLLGISSALTLVTALAWAAPVSANANTPAMNAVQSLCDAWVRNHNSGHEAPWGQVVKPWSTPEFTKALQHGHDLGFDADPLFDTQSGVFGARLKTSKRLTGVEVVPVYGMMGFHAPGVLSTQAVYAKVVARGNRWLVDDWQTATYKSVKSELIHLKPFRQDH